MSASEVDEALNNGTSLPAGSAGQVQNAYMALSAKTGTERSVMRRFELASHPAEVGR